MAKINKIEVKSNFPPQSIDEKLEVIRKKLNEVIEKIEGDN